MSLEIQMSVTKYTVQEEQITCSSEYLHNASN